MDEKNCALKKSTVWDHRLQYSVIASQGPRVLKLLPALSIYCNQAKQRSFCFSLDPCNVLGEMKPGYSVTILMPAGMGLIIFLLEEKWYVAILRSNFLKGSFAAVAACTIFVTSPEKRWCLFVLDWHQFLTLVLFWLSHSTEVQGPCVHVFVQHITTHISLG